MTHDEMEKAEPSEILDEYMNQKNIFNFEGDSGIEKLNSITKAIGYKEHGFKYGSSLEVFLTDNPSAMETLSQWIADNMNEEWAEKVSDELELDE